MSYVASNRRIHGFLATPAQDAAAVGAATVSPAAASLILSPQAAPASAATSAATVPGNAVNPASANTAPDETFSDTNALASALPSAVAHLRAAALAQQISDTLFGGVAGDQLWAWDS